MLKRGFTIEASIIKLELAGNVEQILFDQMKTSLIAFLRERTGNSSLLVQTQIIEHAPDATKPRTTREKFNHLAEKNPVLKELKERFGLDPDLA